MTSFRFIHAADLHLGSPFRGLALKDEAIARRFAAATRNAFTSLIDAAIEEKVAFVVIAGDIYDGEWKDNSIGLFFNRQVARLDRNGIPLVLLRGNHDASSVVTKSISLPDGVRYFGTRTPESISLDQLRVVLHGQGFSDRAATDNLALDYPAPRPGWFNIGVLHTSLSGRANHANYAPCSVDDLRNRGYDYWALGHVHAYELVASDPPIVFPGNIQGRNIRETGSKGAVVVTVKDGRVTAVDRLVIDDARWSQVAVEVDGHDDFAAVLRAVELSIVPVAKEAEGRPVAVRVQLCGKSQIGSWLTSNRMTVADEVQAACHRVQGDIWLEKLELSLAPAPLHDGPGINSEMEALVADAAIDPELKQTASSLVAEITSKLPSGMGAGSSSFDDDAAALLAEAAETVRDVLWRSS